MKCCLGLLGFYADRMVHIAPINFKINFKIKIVLIVINIPAGLGSCALAVFCALDLFDAQAQAAVVCGGVTARVGCPAAAVTLRH